MLNEQRDLQDRDVLTQHPETHDHLPELPAGVVVPDDLSTLHRIDRPRPAVRWLRWATPIALIAAGTVVVATQLGGDGDSVEMPTYPVVSEAAIERMVADEVPAVEMPTYPVVSEAAIERTAQDQGGGEQPWSEEGRMGSIEEPWAEQGR